MTARPPADSAAWTRRYWRVSVPEAAGFPSLNEIEFGPPSEIVTVLFAQPFCAVPRFMIILVGPTDVGVRTPEQVAPAPV